MSKNKGAPSPSLVTSTGTLHDLKSLCDLCGEEADSEVAEVVALDCSYAQCPPEAELYHQACLEKYLKSIRCERNRKIGFPCPRGCGKATKFPEACKGKVQKSHPVTIRSEGNKKRRQAELEQLQRTISADREAEARGKAARKEEAKAAAAGKGKDKKAAAHAAAVEAKARGKAAKPAAVKALNVANTSITQLPPPKSAAQLAKDVLTAERDRIRAQLGARAGGAAAGGPKPAAQPKAAAAAPRERQVRTLEEYEAERAGSSNSSASRLGRAGSPASSAAAAPEAAAAAPAANAWARARAGSGASLGDPSEWSQAPSSRADTPVGGHPPAPAAAAAALQPQGAWAQKQAAAGVLAASLPAAPRPGAGAAAAVGDTEPVDPATAARVPGMDSPPADRGAAAPLTKAQRKNAKRAEKKAAAGARPEDDDADAPELGSLYSALPDVSPLADPQFTVADAAAVLEGAAPGGGGGGGSGPAAAGPSALPVDMFDQCLQLVVQHRLQAQVAQLEAVGFAGGAAVAAVRAAGGDLAAAVEALLSPGVGAWGGAGERDVDVSAELGVLRALRERYRLPAGVVEAVVVDCSGDLVATAALLAEQCEEQPATPPAPHYHDPQQYAAGGGGGVDWGAPDSGGAASAGGGAYSAFAFGGLTEAALTAVHGAGSMFTASVEGTPSAHSAGTPLHQPDSRSGGGGGLWGDYPGAAGSGSGGRGGCHATTAADGGLLAMLGVSGGGGFGAPAPAPAHLAAYSPPGALGGYGSQQWGAEALQPVHQQQQQHGMAAHDQQWGGGQGGGLWGVQGGGVAAGPAPAGLFGAPMQQPQHASQSQELNDLMATLMCS